jgi:predicted nuclease of predicted toxin-antitoxin system
LFIDECLSPMLARRLNESAVHEAVHPLDIGRRGEHDSSVVERCLAEDRVIVTGNARDFRRLLRAVQLHPGLIILPAVDRNRTWQLLQQVIEFLAARGDPMHVMVNHVVEIDISGLITRHPFQTPDEMIGVPRSHAQHGPTKVMMRLRHHAED